MLATQSVSKLNLSAQRFGLDRSGHSLTPQPNSSSASNSKQTLPVQNNATGLAYKAYATPAIKPAPRFGAYENVGDPYFYAGDVILGQHPPDEELDKLDNWRKRIWEAATKPRPGFPNGWLNPYDTRFVVVNGVDLIQAAARGGFLTRYPHCLNRSGATCPKFTNWSSTTTLHMPFCWIPTKSTSRQL